MTAGTLWLRNIACILAVAAPIGLAQADTFTLACAQRDLAVATFIEERGEAADLPAATLGQAGLAHLQAKQSCLAGREAEALVIYDAILRMGGPALAGKYVPDPAARAGGK
jgi:hypothetical protein